MLAPHRTKRVLSQRYDPLSVVKRVIALAENPLNSTRSKHIDVRFHFVRELLRAKKIDIQFVASKEHADILNGYDSLLLSTAVVRGEEKPYGET